MGSARVFLILPWKLSIGNKGVPHMQTGKMPLKNSGSVAGHSSTIGSFIH